MVRAVTETRAIARARPGARLARVINRTPCLGIFWNIVKHLGQPRNIFEHYETLWNIPEHCGTFRNTLEHFGTL